MRSRGGKKSGETRRRKATMKAAMKELLAMPVSDNDLWNTCAAMGVMPEDNQTALLVMLYRKAALLGDVAAFREIRNIIGEDNDAERLKLQKQDMKLKEKKLGGDEEEIPDDGFLDALNGSAADDWKEESDEE